jgi:hypothetical protein
MFARLVAVAGGLLVTLQVVGCAADSAPGAEPPAQVEADEIVADRRLAELKDLIAKHPAAEVDEKGVLEIYAALVDGTLDTKRMEVAATYFAEVTKLAKDDVPGSADTTMQFLYWSMPRDIAAKNSGQTFEESMAKSTGEPHNFPGQTSFHAPFRLRVKGVAQRDYTLGFTICQTRLTARIPKGASPNRTAELAAQAIRDADEALVEKCRETRSPFNLTDFDGLISVSAGTKVDGDTVVLDPDFDA